MENQDELKMITADELLNLVGANEYNKLVKAVFADFDLTPLFEGDDRKIVSMHEFPISIKEWPFILITASFLYEKGAFYFLFNEFILSKISTPDVLLDFHNAYSKIASLQSSSRFFGK